MFHSWRGTSVFLFIRGGRHVRPCFPRVQGGKAMSQYDIMLKSGIPAADIPAFRDPMHWLKYFPPYGEALQCVIIRLRVTRCAVRCRFECVHGRVVESTYLLNLSSREGKGTALLCSSRVVNVLKRMSLHMLPSTTTFHCLRIIIYDV